jgi:outer membrane protein OmpA-like peptidoglycan-associated protein
VTLSNDKVTFPVNRAVVSPDAQALIDDAVLRFKQENRGVFFEIEGHTDNTGPDAYNEKLGLDRATAVRNYLHDQHQIALNRMEVISYGESRPVVDNKTRDHRAQNRRVVIKVLE